MSGRQAEGKSAGRERWEVEGWGWESWEAGESWPSPETRDIEKYRGEKRKEGKNSETQNHWLPCKILGEVGSQRGFRA